MEAGSSFVEFKEKARKKYSSEREQSSDWMHPIKVTLGVMKGWSSNLSIYRVPNRLRNVKKDAYDPRIVSIGPLHHGKLNLLAMEEHKWRYMLILLHRMPNAKENSEKCLNECAAAILDLDPRTRGNYPEPIQCEPKELAEMVLVDACFILELFLRYSYPRLRNQKDPIFNNAWMIPTLQHDLALLENQIPFFILKKLYKIITSYNISIGKSPKGLHHLALSFFHPELDLKQETIIQKCSSGCRHLLDLLHKFYLPADSIRLDLGVDQGKEESASMKTPCLRVFIFCSSFFQRPKKSKGTKGFKYGATKLLESGIEFERGNDQLLDLTFGNGRIAVPPFCIHETTDSLLRNLIAYEQCSLSSSHHITSYAMLMRSLIRSTSDIELLERKEIIKNNMDGAEDVLNLFNSVPKGVILKNFSYGQLCKDVNAYRESWMHFHRHKVFWKARLPRYLVELKQDYASNPWKILSIIAATTLLILTLLQTYYTIHS